MYSAPTACGHTVSGAVSLPSRGAFHLSLTVLVRYRSHGVFSLGRWSSRIPTGFLVPRGTWDPLVGFRLFAYRAVTSCGGPFQTASAKPTALLRESPATPSLLARPGLGSPLFARRYWGVRFFFLFLRLLRCFSSPGAPRTLMCSVYGDEGLPPPGCPIRISADRCLLAAPRSFSQLAASFVGLRAPRHPPYAFRRLTFLSRASNSSSIRSLSRAFRVLDVLVLLRCAVFKEQFDHCARLLAF